LGSMTVHKKTDKLFDRLVEAELYSSAVAGFSGGILAVAAFVLNSACLALYGFTLMLVGVGLLLLGALIAALLERFEGGGERNYKPCEEERKRQV